MTDPIKGQMTVANVQADMIVHPRTGEIIDPRLVQTDALLEARDLLTDEEQALRSFRRQVDDELVRRADHEGRRSITFEHFKIDVTPPTEKIWDTVKLERTLERLVDDGLISQLKAEKSIRYEPKPVWSELKTLLSDPRVREAIEECFTEEDARRYVKVSRRD